MAFDSLASFLTMEGHGPYVWTCYGAFFLLMAVMMVWSVRRRRAVIQSCRRQFESREGKDGSAATRAAATFTRVNVSQD